MAFELPKYTELTPQQRTILNLPLENNTLVSGAPGTGKTVIAIYRASDLSNNDKNVLMLVFNRPLMLYISSAVKSLGIDAKVNTWHSWIDDFYNDNFGHPCPRVGGQQFVFNWTQIKIDFDSLDIQYDHIIIDEAQDVPLELIDALQKISSSMSCFMDPNQTIAKKYTTVNDVAHVLNVRGSYTLYDNFRNPKEIFDLAKLYNATNKVEAVRETGEKPYLYHATDYDDQLAKMVAIIKRNFGLNYIGVFTNPNVQARKSYPLYSTYKGLKDALEPSIHVYKYESDFPKGNLHDFEKPGVYVMSFNCMKGLEFDAVIIPRCEKIKASYEGDARIDKNIFYVALTRASEKVYCFYFDERCTHGWIDVFGPLSGHDDLVTRG